jgi:hypothetical protein
MLRKRLIKPIFRQTKSISSQSMIGAIKNHVPPLKFMNLQSKGSNFIITLIVFSINMWYNEKHMLCALNIINERLRWIQGIIDKFLKARVTRVESVSIQSKFQPFLLAISIVNIIRTISTWKAYVTPRFIAKKPRVAAELSWKVISICQFCLDNLDQNCLA